MCPYIMKTKREQFVQDMENICGWMKSCVIKDQLLSMNDLLIKKLDEISPIVDNFQGEDLLFIGDAIGRTMITFDFMKEKIIESNKVV